MLNPIFISFCALIGLISALPSYHEDSYEDYPASEKCGHYMIFDHKQGKCTCEPEDSYESHGPLIYHKQTDQCYLPNTRAYCKEGELLQKDGKCQKNENGGQKARGSSNSNYDFHDFHAYDHYEHEY